LFFLITIFKTTTDKLNCYLDQRLDSPQPGRDVRGVPSLAAMGSGSVAAAGGKKVRELNNNKLYTLLYV
jgi:hypothetical protein